ncbi:MAG: DUF935 domain-containing protein, partial [Myxococcales bacterium]|nr:DUF935 domain-containing protein [Myxococcales bacterium]
MMKLADMWRLATGQRKPKPDLMVYGGASSTGTFSVMSEQDEWNPDLKGIEGLKTLNRMVESDPTCSAVYNAMTLPIIGTTWSVEPYSDDAKDVDAARMVEEMLFSLDG